MAIPKTFSAILTDSRVISFFPPEHILEQWRAELSPKEVFLRCAKFQRRLKLQDRIAAIKKLPLPVVDAREVL